MRAFTHALPAAWTCDVPAQGNDYGIDATVELFSADGDALGTGFFAQVKATANDGPNALTASIKVSTWRRYLRLDRPVLLVRFVASNETLYTLWAHQTRDAPSDPSQASVAIRWTPDDLWTDETPARIEADVLRFRAAKRATLVRPVGIHIDVLIGERLTSPLSREVRRELRRLERLVGRGVSVTMGKVRPPETLVDVSISDEGFWLDYGGIAGAQTDLPRQLDTPDAAKGLAATALALSGICASRIGQDVLAAELLEVSLPAASLRFTPGFVAESVLALARTGRSDAILLYIHDLSQLPGDLPEVLVSLGAAVLAARSVSPALPRESLDALMDAYVDICEEQGDDGVAGAAYYTLANHLRAGLQVPDRNRRALSAFNRAQKLEPDYLQRSYFVSEVAAALFDLNRPLRSAAWYARGVDLGDDHPFTLARWGDALLNAGEVQAAADGIRPYVDAFDDLSEAPYWWIRLRLAEHLAQTVGPAFRRDPSAAVALPQVSEMATPEARLASSQARLALDPLNAAAWFNVGLARHQLRQPGSARAFAFAASIKYGDSEAWANAFCGFATTKPDDDTQLWIAATGYAGLQSGPEFVDKVEEFVEAQDDPDSFSYLLDLLDVVDSTQHRPSHHPMTLRVNGEPLSDPLADRGSM